MALRIIAVDSTGELLPELEQALAQEQDFDVVATFPTLERAAQDCHVLWANAVLWRLTSVGCQLSDLSQLKSDFGSCLIVCLSEYQTEEWLIRAKRAGVDLYLPDSCPMPELFSLLRNADTLPLAGTDAQVSTPGLFYALEQHMLELIQNGAKLRDVAQELGLSQNTVRQYLAGMLGRLNFHNQQLFVNWARSEGMTFLK